LAEKTALNDPTTSGTFRSILSDHHFALDISPKEKKTIKINLKKFS
jgi:hypothetical protein